MTTEFHMSFHGGRLYLPISTHQPGRCRLCREPLSTNPLEFFDDLPDWHYECARYAFIDLDSDHVARKYDTDF